MLTSPIASPLPMHIPDGFLSVVVSLPLWVISLIIIGIALRKANKLLGERDVPLMGIMAAAIFAGQMLNFSVTGGTSGHLLGAALATILLGPWPAILVMTSVVSVQALLFQDGGILVLGANLFNMAIVGVAVSYTVYNLLKGIFPKKPLGNYAAGFAAAWASIFIASLSCGLQLALSGTSPANIALPVMAGIHALIGVGEGLITLGALAFLYGARRDLLTPTLQKTRESNPSILIGGALISLVLVILSPLASSHPDGLEWVAEKYHFIDTAQEALYNLIPDYTMPGIENPAFATIAAGILGLVVVFGVSYGVARAERRGS